MIRHIPWNTTRQHADDLHAGLKALGPDFIAKICYWCNGTGTRGFEQCSECGRGKPYGTSLGLLQGLAPAPDSVVNQVLVAAERLRTCKESSPQRLDV